MARGTAGVKRTRTISVRVSDAEWEAWEARRERSGRAEMGAWVRAVVTDAGVDEAVHEDVGAGADVDLEATSGPSRDPGAPAEPIAESSSGLSSEVLPAARAPRRAAGDRPVVPEVNERAYAVLVGAANNLNQLTRFSHQVQALVPGIEAAMAEVVEASRAVRGIVVAPSPRATSTSRGGVPGTARRRPARAGGTAS